MLALLLVVLFQSTAYALSVTVNARSQECVALKLATTETLSGSFDVLTAGATHVRVHATSRETQNRRINFDKTPRSTFTLTPDHAEGDNGLYDLCFENLDSFPIHIGFGFYSNLDPSSDVATDKDALELQQMALGLLHRLVEMERQQTFAIRREASQLEAAEAAASRVAFWILAKVLAAIGTVLVGVFYLRSFFEVKQVV